MNAKELYDWINSFTQDIDFVYKGIWGSICPFSRSDIALAYNGTFVNVDSVEAAMCTPFIDGYSLFEVCEELEL